MSQIIDCFIFYNELDMLTYRLNLLDNLVDFFVLVESTHTFVGKEKPLFYAESKHLFDKFNHKIIHIIVDDFPYKYPNICIEKSEQWINEKFQRNCISRGIDKLNLNNQDIITIGDLDEILNPNVLEQIKNNNIIIDVNKLEMDFYYYNLHSKMDHKWYNSKIISFKKYKELNILCDQLRFYKCPVIKNGGWHLSYFGNEQFIKNKLENFSHQEFNKLEFTDEKQIEQRIKNRKDLFDRSHKIIHVEIEDNDNLPPQYDIYLKSFYTTNTQIEKENKVYKIAFWNNQLCERGTSLGLYNYAFYNEKILGNKSYIFYDKNSPLNQDNIIEKFKTNFEVFPVENFYNVDDILLKNNITHFFIIKSGQKDGKLSKVAKNCVQCVFNCNEPHGEVYCSISNDVHGNNGKYPVIPRMITLPNENSNMRERLHIPTNAIVFGGYGGKQQFDIKYVQNVVYKIAKNNKHIYFLFANFNRFCEELDNIIHLPTIYEENEKVSFINTSDAMLWARSDGETFGQAIAEFSIRNKPVIATKVGALSHVKYLGDKAIWYSNERDLTEILLNFNPMIESKKDWNAYRDYTPEKVMKIFDNVFLKNDITSDKPINKIDYNTFCTFWFDIGDKNIQDIKNSSRTKQTYLNSFNKLVKKCDNLYVWCDDAMYEDIKHLQNQNVIIKQKNITELPLYNKKSEIMKSLTEMYKNKDHNRFSLLFKNHKNIEGIANYLIIVNSKFYMIKSIKDINPFNSHLFSWIDFGIHQHNFNINNYSKFIPKYTNTLNICCNYDNLDIKLDIEDKLYIYGNQKIEFACTLFTVNINFIDNLCKNYYDYLDSLLLKNLISTEQPILTLFCNVYNLFNSIDIHQGSYNSLQKLFKPLCTIGLAILTHNRPDILNQTLKSYKEKGFLDFFDEKIILLQENLYETRKIAEKYDLKIYSTENNIGIGPGNNFLIDKLNTDYFIICQDDFKLIKDNYNTQIYNAIKLIDDNYINCCRLRNLQNPGEPMCSSKRYLKPDGDLDTTNSSGCLYYNFITNPDKMYPDIFNNYNTENNIWILESKYANYTENPCLYKRDWYIENIYELNKIGGRNAENNVQVFWQNQNFKIGMAEGIFTHADKLLHNINVDTLVDTLHPLIEEEKQKIQKVNGLMTSKQYELIYKIIKSRSACNLLVFGLGEDSYLWTSANNGGKTVFIENIKSWAEKFTDLDVEIVKYNTTVLDFPHNLNADKLLLDLPERIKDYKWDIIIIDSPVGHNPPCIKDQCNLCSPTNPAPGRMASIYTASKLVHNKSIIIVDDTNREIENKCTKLYIEPNFKVQFDDGKVRVLAN